MWFAVVLACLGLLVVIVIGVASYFTARRNAESQARAIARTLKKYQEPQE